jgi:hypothetical protein
MTTLEILLVLTCAALAGWCWFMQKHIVDLQGDVIGLQGVAINQIAINEQHAEVRSILNDVNASLIRIIGDEK